MYWEYFFYGFSMLLSYFSVFKIVINVDKTFDL